MLRWMLTTALREQTWSLNIEAETLEEAIAIFFDEWPDADDYSIGVVCVEGSPHMEVFWEREKALHMGPYCYSF